MSVDGEMGFLDMCPFFVRNLALDARRNLADAFASFQVSPPEINKEIDSHVFRQKRS